MMSPSHPDPFLEAQADILSTLSTTRSLHSSYIRIRSLASSPSSPELAQARSELESALHTLSTDLQDLADSVRAVENDPLRYGIQRQELERRRRLVGDVGREAESMGVELRRVSSSAGAMRGSNTKGGGLPLPEEFDPDLPDREEADGYEAFEQQRQVEMMQEQDEALDGVFQTVGNLRQQADDMGRELEEQVEMLGEADADAQRVQGKLQTGIKKVGHVLRRSEGMSSSWPWESLEC
ncbi:MAG: hypothetical protein Q9190_007093 [Brigantiaea leucoxantha]